jgi:hypothetical protein
MSKKQSIAEQLNAELEVAQGEMNQFIDANKAANAGRITGGPAEVLALPALRTQQALAFAMVLLAEQQRAANLLVLARFTTGPISDEYIGQARLIIAPRSG